MLGLVRQRKNIQVSDNELLIDLHQGLRPENRRRIIGNGSAVATQAAVKSSACYLADLIPGRSNVPRYTTLITYLIDAYLSEATWPAQCRPITGVVNPAGFKMSSTLIRRSEILSILQCKAYK